MTEFGRCLKHGVVAERCCVLFEPDRARARPFLRPALQAAVTRVYGDGWSEVVICPGCQHGAKMHSAAGTGCIARVAPEPGYDFIPGLLEEQLCGCMRTAAASSHRPGGWRLVSQDDEA